MDANTALILLKKLNNKEDITSILINSIKSDPWCCIHLIFENIITNPSERIKIIQRTNNRDILINLIKEKKINNKERIYAFENILQNSTYTLKFIELISDISECEQKSLIKYINSYSCKIITERNLINKFIPKLQYEIFSKSVKNSQDSYEILKNNKNLIPEFRKIAFDHIVTSGHYCNKLLYNKSITKDEKEKLFRKIVTTKSYLKQVLLSRRLTLEENQLIIKLALENQKQEIFPIIYEFMEVPEEIKESVLPYAMMYKIDNKK